MRSSLNKFLAETRGTGIVRSPISLREVSLAMNSPAGRLVPVTDGFDVKHFKPTNRQFHAIPTQFDPAYYWIEIDHEEWEIALFEIGKDGRCWWYRPGIDEPIDPRKEFEITSFYDQPIKCPVKI